MQTMQAQTWASRLCLSARPSAASSAWEAGCLLSTANMLWQAAPECSAAPLAASSAACTSSLRRDTWHSARCSRLCICRGRSGQRHCKHSSGNTCCPSAEPAAAALTSAARGSGAAQQWGTCGGSAACWGNNWFRLLQGICRSHTQHAAVGSACAGGSIHAGTPRPYSRRGYHERARPVGG